MVNVMLKALRETFIICSVIATLIFPPGSMAQIRQRSVCGRTVKIPDGTVRTEALLYFGAGGFDDLLAGVVTEPGGAFCIENNVRDLTERASARLYLTSFCRSDDVTLVNVPFWPRLRREPGFSGKRIVVGPGSVTSLGDVDVQIMYGHLTLRVLDRQQKPLLTQLTDWSRVWIRVRDKRGATVHESGLSVADIKRSVDLKESRINLALPKGMWTLEVALAGVPSHASRHEARWLRVPRKVSIESCREVPEVTLSAMRNEKVLTFWQRLTGQPLLAAGHHCLELWWLLQSMIAT
jgi:hypothetical protein